MLLPSSFTEEKKPPHENGCMFFSELRPPQLTGFNARLCARAARACCEHATLSAECQVDIHIIYAITAEETLTTEIGAKSFRC